MALNPRSVNEVEILFGKLFPDHSIGYTGRNQHGADEVYIYKEGSIQTPEIQEIVLCSKKIGNTVSLIPHQKESLLICFW
jgi:hypothetical protein